MDNKILSWGSSEEEKKPVEYNSPDYDNQALMNMGVATLTGALFGDVGAGLKEAVSQRDKFQNRKDSFNTMRQKLLAKKKADSGSGPNFYQKEIFKDSLKREREKERRENKIRTITDLENNKVFGTAEELNKQTSALSNLKRDARLNQAKRYGLTGVNTNPANIKRAGDLEKAARGRLDILNKGDVDVQNDLKSAIEGLSSGSQAAFTNSITKLLKAAQGGRVSDQDFILFTQRWKKSDAAREFASKGLRGASPILKKEVMEILLRAYNNTGKIVNSELDNIYGSGGAAFVTPDTMKSILGKTTTSGDRINIPLFSGKDKSISIGELNKLLEKNETFRRKFYNYTGK